MWRGWRLILEGPLRAMVLALLLSDPSTPVRYRDLGRTVLQCLHVIHSIERALSVFHSALMYGDLDSFPCSESRPSQLLSAFDAHVGDCACQTRVQMLLDIVILYSAPENKLIVRRALDLLKQVQVNTALLLWEIQQSHGKPRNPKLNDLGTHMAIWDRIHFASFLELVADTSCRRVATSGAPDPFPVSRHCQGLPGSSFQRRDVIFDTHWNPHNFLVIIRFLTMSHLLSECKVVIAESGPPTRLSVHLDLQLMHEKKFRELETLQLETEAPSCHIKSQDGVSQIKRQCEAMQIYLSKVTEDWARQTATRTGNQNLWPSFPEGFVAANDRHISCVSSYVSMLLLRTVWVTLDTPILVVVQRFCSHGGYHNIYCRFVGNCAARIPSKDLFHGIGEHSWFEADVIPFEQLVSSPWARIPHVILIGMSGEGTIEDFQQRLLASKRGRLLPQHHDHERCSEIGDCELAIKHTNFSRLLAHCFAQHEQFPFRLPGHEDGFERVATLLRPCLGKEAEDAFTEARLLAEQFGTGQSTRLFTIQHFFLEYPSVLGRNIKDHGETPRFFGCKMELS